MRTAVGHTRWGSRPWTVVGDRSGLPRRVPAGTDAVVVGGGVAGMAAALVLAERGVRVTLCEAADHLGGRLVAWPRAMSAAAGGGTQVVEHGYHGFFRQYYTLRALLRRVDPELGFLRPVDGYPIVSREWPTEDFADLPTLPPLGLLALVLRSPSLRLADLRAMDGAATMPLLAFDRARTYADFDGVPASELLDSFGMPDRARAMLFEVFAHSFFNSAREMSAAEMIMMFHFYFLRNPEGLGMDAPDTDYLSCIWRPLAERVGALGGEVRAGTPVDRVEPRADGRWTVTLRGGEDIPARHVVLAADPRGVRALLDASPGLAAAGPRLTAGLRSLATAPPYAVSRLWVDRPTDPGRAVFTGVSREPTLDSVTQYSRLEREPAAWAARTGGAVLELHGYAVDDGMTEPGGAAEATARMRAELAGLWPETAAMQVLDVEERVGAEAPAFGLGSDRTRPGVVTDARGVRLAGDWVRMPFPSALLERAAASGVLAANDVLREEGAAPEPVRCVPPRGFLAGRRPR